MNKKGNDNKGSKKKSNKFYRIYMNFNKKGKKLEIKLAIGKEFWILFLGPILLFYRKQFLLGIISILTIFLADIYFYFRANDLRIKKYEKKGWVLIADPLIN